MHVVLTFFILCQRKVKRSYLYLNDGFSSFRLITAINGTIGARICLRSAIFMGAKRSIVCGNSSDITTRWVAGKSICLASRKDGKSC